MQIEGIRQTGKPGNGRFQQKSLCKSRLLKRLRTFGGTNAVGKFALLPGLSSFTICHPELTNISEWRRV